MRERDILRLAIIIPLLAAVITGALVLALALAVAAWQRWPGMYALIGAAGAALLSWFAWAGRMAQILEYRLAPGLPKPTQAKEQTLNLRIHEAQSGVFLDLPVNEQALAALAGMVLSGQSLTTSQVCASGFLTRASWEGLRDRFVSAGLLSWRGGARQWGVEITPRGWAIFKRLADPTHPPARIS